MRPLNALGVTLPAAHPRVVNDALHVNVRRESRLQVTMHYLTSVGCLGGTARGRNSCVSIRTDWSRSGAGIIRLHTKREVVLPA